MNNWVVGFLVAFILYGLAILAGLGVAVLIMAAYVEWGM